MNTPVPLRNVRRWLAPLLILGAAVVGAFLSDWLISNFSSSDDISAAVVLWGVLAEVLAVGAATIALARAEKIRPPILPSHLRHSLLLYFLVLSAVAILPDAGHTSHLFQYYLALAVAGLATNAGVLRFSQWIVPRGEA